MSSSSKVPIESTASKTAPELARQNGAFVLHDMLASDNNVFGAQDFGVSPAIRPVPLEFLSPVIVRRTLIFVFVLDATRRFDLKLKSGELPPGEERGAIEITTQWFYNPNIAAKDKTKKMDFVPRWLQDADSDTEVLTAVGVVCGYVVGVDTVWGLTVWVCRV